MARIAGRSENTVKSWALRYQWNKLPNPAPILRTQFAPSPPAAIVADELLRNNKRSRLALSHSMAEAAQQAADSGGDLSLAHNVRDVAAIHWTLWPQELAKACWTLLY